MKFIVALITVFVLSNFVMGQKYFMQVKLRDGTLIQYDLSTVHKINFDGIVGIDDFRKMNQIVSSFKLNQNYPNPFNPSTTIEYYIPRTGNVSIQIFDLSGRLIKKFKEKYRNQGNYKEIWDGMNQNGSKVASGFYIYSVIYEHNVYSKKMMLIK